MSSLHQFCQRYPFLIENDDNVYCSCCDQCITSKVSNVTAHLQTTKHIQREEGKLTQQEFNLDLTNFLVASNIPWVQLENENFRNFLQKCIEGKYAKTTRIPSESSLRVQYLPKMFKEVFDSVRNDIADSYIYVSVDETKDQLDQNVANVIVGALRKTHASKPHIIASKVLDRTNHTTVSSLVTESLKNLYGNDNYYERVVLFLTDGAPYMVKAGKTLRNSFPNMIHVTCLAHGFNRVADTVRGLYEDVNELISSMKTTFLKSPSRTKKLKQLYPNMPQPPRPVITRWNTWIEACIYYNTYFDEIKNVLNNLDDQNTAKVRRAKLAIGKPHLKNHLEFITASCTVLVKATKQMESSTLTLSESLQVVKTVTAKLSRVSLHEKGKHIYKKHKNVLHKNKELPTMQIMADLNDNKEVRLDGNKEKIDLWPYFKYAPITSVEVERSFSILKWMFTNRRCSMTPKNLEQILIINFESKYKAKKM